MTTQRLPLPMDGPAAVPDPGPPAPPEPLADPLTQAQIVELKDRLVQELHTCFDPEIPVNIYELGLIYDLTIAPTAEVHVRMTLTTPMCPAAGSLPGEVECKLRAIKPVTAVKVELIWDPPWNKDRMSEAAKLQLGIDD
jgi:FeS assembly SUF system protein